MTIGVTVHVDLRNFTPAFHELAAAIPQAVNQAMREAIGTATRVAKGTTTYKDRTGRLRRETYGSFTKSDGFTDAAGFVIADTSYARFQNDGTGIYGPKGRPIVPVKAKVLRFVVGGRTVFAHSVRGVRPGRFMDWARMAGDRVLRDGAETYVGRTVAAFNAAGDI